VLLLLLSLLPSGAAAGTRGPLTQQLQVLYAALVEADVAAGRDAAWDDEADHLHHQHDS
jgi:hypothetical protein